MACHINTIKDWSASLGAKKNTDILEHLLEAIAAARSGDQAMPQMPGVDDVPSMMLDIIKKPPPEATLKAYHTRATVISAEICNPN